MEREGTAHFRLRANNHVTLANPRWWAPVYRQVTAARARAEARLAGESAARGRLRRGPWALTDEAGMLSFGAPHRTEAGDVFVVSNMTARYQSGDCGGGWAPTEFVFVASAEQPHAAGRWRGAPLAGALYSGYEAVLPVGRGPAAPPPGGLPYAPAGGRAVFLPPPPGGRGHPARLGGRAGWPANCLDGIGAVARELLGSGWGPEEVLLGVAHPAAVNVLRGATRLLTGRVRVPAAALAAAAVSPGGALAAPVLANLDHGDGRAVPYSCEILRASPAAAARCAATGEDYVAVVCAAVGGPRLPLPREDGFLGRPPSFPPHWRGRRGPARDREEAAQEAARRALADLPATMWRARNLGGLWAAFACGPDMEAMRPLEVTAMALACQAVRPSPDGPYAAYLAWAREAHAAAAA